MAQGKLRSQRGSFQKYELVGITGKLARVTDAGTSAEQHH